jgi:hypothetical protein
MEEFSEEGRIMKTYEAVWEIFNQCPNNQMRDVFIEEIETDDPETYIRDKFKDKEMTYEKTVRPDGTMVFDIITSGIHQRYTFSE